MWVNFTKIMEFINIYSNRERTPVHAYVYWNVVKRDSLNAYRSGTYKPLNVDHTPIWPKCRNRAE